jgi:predicted RNase H-like HicB family nuclease
VKTENREGISAMTTYLVVIGKTSTGYSAHCPDVQGCAAVGKSVEKVLANMKRALEFHFEGMREDGEAIPKPSGSQLHRQVMKDLDVDRYFLGHVQTEAGKMAAGGKRSSSARRASRATRSTAEPANEK